MPGTNPTLDPEWSLLLVACSAIPLEEKLDCVRLLLSEPVRWELLFNLADRHGTQLLLYQALLAVDDAVPLPEMQMLKQVYGTNLHKALLLSRELIHLVDHLSGLGIEVVPYKGLALAETLYGDIALRPAGDIDLLIRPQDLSRVQNAVRELGYAPHLRLSEAEQRTYLQSGYESAFDSAAGRNLLEVQWAILPRFYAVDFDMNGMFERAVTTRVAGYPMRTLSAADLLLVLAAHAAKHVLGRLIWLCDIARIMPLPNLDWDWIASCAKELGILRILHVTMLLANRLLKVTIPAGQRILLEDRGALTVAKEIQAHITRGNIYDVESLAYFRLMMRLRERPADQLRFLERLIVTPGPSEWRAVRLPQSLFPLYRLVRLSRLAARLVGA